MKFHINDKNEAKRCRATVEACRFGGGESKDSNHYDSKEAAEKEAQRRNVEKYGETGESVTKRRSKDEYAPRVVENALTPEQIQDSRPDSDNKFFKTYNQTVEILKNMKIESNVDQQAAYMLQDIVGDSKDDMTTDDGVDGYLFDQLRSDDPDVIEASNKLYKMLSS